MGNCSTINRNEKMTITFTEFYSLQAVVQLIVPINPQIRTMREIFLSLFHGRKTKILEIKKKISKLTQPAAKRTKIHAEIYLNPKLSYNRGQLLSMRMDS